MAANTSKGITYPTSSDSIASLETVFATMANTTNTALTSINASTDITQGVLPVTRGGTGGDSVGFRAGKNKILNADFSIWQRSTPITVSTSATYTADRWRVDFDGTGATRTISQVSFVTGTAPVAGSGYESTYYLRFAQSVAGSSATYNALTYLIEDVRTFAGKTVTVSFWAKAAATFTKDVSFNQYGGPASTIGPLSNPTSVTGIGLPNTLTVTTSWARYSFTITIPTLSGTITTNSYLQLVIGLPINSTFTFDIWGVQVEAGTVATDFVTATGNPASELAACQRYFFRGGNGGSGVFSGATISRFNVQFPVEMRATPTITAIAAPNALNPTVLDSQTGSQTTNFLATATGGLVTTKAASKIQFGGFASAADGRPSILLNDCLQFSAEQ